MRILTHKNRYYLLSFLKHDFKASVTVYFVALPLCLGVSLASGVPVYCGLISGIVGGIIIPMISKSTLSVSGPAAGLTAICATAIAQLGRIELLFLSIGLAGLMQILLGIFRLGGFTHFIPSSVIRGLLAAIGIILISKQVPLLIGYNKPDFWRDELFNILTLRHGFDQISNLYEQVSPGAIIVTTGSLVFLITWKKTMARKITFLPASFLTVLFGSVISLSLNRYAPLLGLSPEHFVTIPANVLTDIRLPEVHHLFNSDIWNFGLIICFVASLETLLSIEAIDKMDPYNRITPQNRELVAQGTANLASGILGGLPITSVIVRSSANAEAGARTKLSALFHGVWLLLTVLLATAWVNQIPYSVLAVLLIRTGYNLAKPAMILATYRQGREQFFPFIVTIGAILITDLLIGVLIGIAYAIYFLIKHTYRAGYTLHETSTGHTRHFRIELALNVSFLNKKRIRELLDSIPAYATVEIDGTDSVYIDYDILEIIQSFKPKARMRHIHLITKAIPEVNLTELH